MTPGKRFTIRDVAEAAGVSTQTVSRVLNNRPDVAPETFARIQKIIEETGYAPNMLARSLTQGRSHILGVVAYGLEYFGPSRVLTGIEQQAAAMGYSISLNLLHEPETADLDRLFSMLFARRVDGVLWAVPGVGNNRTWLDTRAQAFPVPIVLVGGMAGQVDLPSLGVDNRAIGRLATEHLLAGGARQVGIITGPMQWWETQQRLAGWRETLEAHGAIPEESLIEVGDWTPSTGEEAFYRLVAKAPEIDGIFVSNDQMALGVLHAAHRLGRSIPRDLSVVGVDNIPESSHFWPSLTTVHQPLGEAGALAVQAIDAAIKGRRHGRSAGDGPEQEVTLLEPKLLVRESSMPARSSVDAASARIISAG